MNKLLFSLSFLFLVGCASTEQKTEQTEQPTVETTEVVAGKSYACPMKCEGDKEYHEAGKCPVCKMDLEEVAMVESDSTQHAHE